MKKIFVIDRVLIPVFALSAFSGIQLHVAGHGASHEAWHNWAVFHIVVSVLFLIAVILHVKTHRGWYKSLVKNGLGNKSKAVVAVTLFFAVLAATGLVLLGVKGAHSGIGLWHYRMGLVASVLFAEHIIHRMPVLRKTIQGKRSVKKEAA
ncbi:MAG: DUF4405 domain-containing protein [Paludibacteraceae bacterium]